ncbi:ferredoxin-type protein NapF [Simiduia litorea]|uniref:ferredoxin-type protein NapF n=1 Tax=Simiduia litorea TaxID=1435348 RepID=UPI0036F3FE52
MSTLSRRQLIRGAKTQAAPSLPWTDQVKIVDACTRCGDCISACEESIIIKADGGFPRIDFNLGGCTGCEKCLDVCEAPIFGAANGSLWPTTIAINSQCLTHSGVYCQSCRDSCDRNAISFSRASIPSPQLDTDACNSCGACISVCPTEAIQWQQAE